MQRAADLRGRVDDPPMRQTEHADTVEQQPGVAFAIALERSAGVVVAPAVGLDDQMRVGPVEIHLEARDAHVDQRARDAEAGAEPEQALLELASREPLELVCADQPAKTRGTVSRRMSIDHTLDRDEVEEPQPLRRLDRPFHGMGREHLGQVEQRARRRRQREAVVRRRLERLDRHPVHAEPRARAAPGLRADRDLEARARIGAHSPRRTRRAVAEHRTVADREHGGDPSPVDTDGEMADGVDPAVQPVQRATSQPSVDRSGWDTQCKQLKASDDAALAGRELGDQVIVVALGAFSFHGNE
jgi:hypothetical protein